MFTEAEKVDVRRFCGYPAYGAGPSGFQGWRFFQAFGLLEFRLNNLDPTEETVVRTIYLQQLYPLELGIAGAAANLDTDQAAVWKHNRDEVAHRDQLFANWRAKLCRFLGVPLGDALKCSTDLIV
jgi:hypothetical protein